MTPARLKKVVADLTVLQPPLYPVIVQRTKKLAPGDFGDTELVKRGGERRLLIRLNSNYDQWVQLATLVHEWAHCAQWRPKHQEERRQSDHDPEWGVIFAKLWALFFDD